MAGLEHHLVTGLRSTAWQLGMILGPVVAACVVLHLLNRALNVRMARLIGRARIYLTGWIGTPIHELSHAAMCVVFRHRIDEIKLFSPDSDGRLGYVRHAYNPKSLFQQIGNFFIGVAPLFGGVAVLLLLLVTVHPGSVDLFGMQAGELLRGGDLSQGAAALWDRGRAIAQAVFAPEHRGNWRFWLFVYLAFCVSSHLAPSRTDLRGSLLGGFLCLALVFVGNVALSVASIDVAAVLSGASAVLAPTFALLCFAIVLNVVWLAVVSLVLVAARR